MNPNTSLIAGILLVGLALVVGISIVAKNSADTRNPDVRDATAYNPAVDASPRNRGAGPGGAGKAAAGNLSTLATAEQALRAMQKLPRKERWEKEKEFVKRVDPALYSEEFFTRLLRLIVPENTQSQPGSLLPILLGEWAKK